MSRFAELVASFADKAMKDADAIKRAVVIELGTAIINDTPVSDEETAPGKPHGFLKGNWQTFIDAAPDTTIDLRPGSEAISELEETAAKAEGKDTLILRNNTIYGPRIEFEGWSHTKAPAGMVRINVTRFEEAVNQATSKVST